jgi:uncharacterized protein
MGIVEILKIGIALAIGSIVQSSAGFGFSLVALPLMLFMGFNLPQAVMINIIASAFQKITAITYIGKSVDWKGHYPYMTIGFLALPVGVFCQYHASFLRQSYIEMGLGVIILVSLVLQWAEIIKVKEKVSCIWGYVAGFSSGFLNGLANIGGPPLVLWILAHSRTWTNEKMRATPIAFALVSMPLQIVFMIIAFGSKMWNPMIKALLLLPVVFAASWIGLKIGEKFSKPILQLYMRLLLLFVVLSSIVKPFI